MIDPGYFKPLPSNVLQVIVLYWLHNNEAPGKKFNEMYEKNFPIEKLAAMIDK